MYIPRIDMTASQLHVTIIQARIVRNQWKNYAEEETRPIQNDDKNQGG